MSRSGKPKKRPDTDAGDVKNAKRVLRHFFLLCINVVLFYTVYILLTRQGALAAKITMWAYLLLTVGFFGAYLIYNRGFTMVNRAPDSFPDEMSAAEKCAILAEGQRRRDKSKWMLLILIPLLFVWMIDMVDLFLLDGLRALFA